MCIPLFPSQHLACHVPATPALSSCSLSSVFVSLPNSSPEYAKHGFSHSSCLPHHGETWWHSRLSIYSGCLIYLLTDSVQFSVLALTSRGREAEVVPKSHAAVSQDDTDKPFKFEMRKNVTVKTQTMGWKWFWKIRKIRCLVDSATTVHLKVTKLFLLSCSQPPGGDWAVLYLSCVWLDWSVLSKMWFKL